MSPEQLREEIADEKRLGIHLSILARCTGCGLGYISTAPGHLCLRCEELVELWPWEEAS